MQLPRYIPSPGLFSYFNHFLEAQRSDLSFFFREGDSSKACAECIICSITRFDGTTHGQTIICREPVICRSRGGLSANGKEAKMQ